MSADKPPRRPVPAGPAAGPTEPPVPGVLRGALYLLVADGLAALYLGEFLGWPGLVLMGVLLGASLRGDALLRRLGPGWHLVGRALVPAAALASALDVLVLAETMADALVRLLCFVLLHRLFTLRSVGETRTVCFLAFFMLVAASASAFGLGFLFVFLAFVVLVTWVLLLQHLLLESAPGSGRALVGPQVPGRQRSTLWRLTAAAALGIVGLTAALFFLLPRIGLAALPFRMPTGQMVTGFSERVELGAYGSILMDETIVMRVHLPNWPNAADPPRLPGLRWRGIALDEFDGWAWSIRQPRRTRLLTVAGGGVRLSPARGTGPVLRQEVFLEPLGSDAIFVAPRALALAVRSDVVSLDDTGSLGVARPAARLVYAAESELEIDTPPRVPPGSLEAATRARYVQLPPLSPRVRALARQVATGPGTEPRADAARRLTAFLSREYRYTLDIPRIGDRRGVLDPVEEFLFVRRAGHCEYFATALAVMLRTLDIPARIVNGFQRGEWNPYGGYFMVRLRDAHSWVEAYIEGRGWITLDPSPRVEGDRWTPPGALALYLDTLKLRWHRYVINWSIRDQMRAAGELQQRLSAWGAWLRETLRSADGARVAAWALGGLLAGAGVGVAFRQWRRDRPSASRGAGRPPRFYERALRAVARSGLRPHPGETAREFSARVARLGPESGALFARLTLAYEQCRFGGARLPPRDLAALSASAAALDAMMRPMRPPRRSIEGSPA